MSANLLVIVLLKRGGQPGLASFQYELTIKNTAEIWYLVIGNLSLAY